MTLKWKNETGINYEEDLEQYLGFVYEIELKDGRYYVGRKQFWSRRNGNWVESDWRDYQSTSTYIREHPECIISKSIIGVFSSKSALRYAEGMAIVVSRAYYDSERGLNWSFDSCKGTLKLTDDDRGQMERLYRRWK
jgi:hypothetical protein